MRRFVMAIAALCTLLLSGCGYNELQRRDEQVKAAWAEVLNQYQRRADLVPNLVNTVKGFAQQEQQVLTQVTEARARAGSIQATPELVDNPEAFARFQAAQRVLLDGFRRSARHDQNRDLAALAQLELAQLALELCLLLAGERRGLVDDPRGERRNRELRPCRGGKQ